MNVLLFGHGGKVGSVLAAALAAEGHRVEGVREARPGFDAAVDFTEPGAVVENVGGALALGTPCVIGTSGFDTGRVDALAREAGLPCFYAPNFALGAVLMMRFAAEAAGHLPRAAIVELHHETKRDAPSGTARATAERLPGLVAHQEVLLGGTGELLTIRHDTFSREAFAPGVLLALDRLRDLPPGLTIGLEELLA